MPKENSTARKRSPNLPRKYREAAYAVYMTVEFTPRGPGDPMERHIIDIYDHSKSAIKANITRMCLRAGVERTDSQREDFEAAVREALRKQAEEGSTPPVSWDLPTTSLGLSRFTARSAAGRKR